jgi:uncharacterized membrane protein
MQTTIMRTLLLTVILMTLMNVTVGIASHYPVPVVQAIFAATNHLLYFTYCLTAACLLTRQFALLLSYIGIAMLCSMSNPGFDILTILYPVVGGLIMGIILTAVIKDNLPPPTVQPPPMPPPPPANQPPPPAPPREYQRRGPYDRA